MVSFTNLKSFHETKSWLNHQEFVKINLDLDDFYHSNINQELINHLQTKIHLKH